MREVGELGGGVGEACSMWLIPSRRQGSLCLSSSVCVCVESGGGSKLDEAPHTLYMETDSFGVF